jgi:hypothetical protein
MLSEIHPGSTSGINESNELNKSTINPDKGMDKIIQFLEGKYKPSYYNKKKINTVNKSINGVTNDDMKKAGVDRIKKDMDIDTTWATGY